jgi:hypothetical protein
MADHLYKAQVSLRRTTALPEDIVSNTWHFDKDEASAGDWASGAAALATRLATFYTAITAMLSEAIAGEHSVKVYDMHDALPRVPKYSTTFALSPSGASMPGEVAVCLSFIATLESGVNMKRRKGRVFIGPIAASVGANALLAGDVRPSSSIRTLLTTAGLDLVLGDAGDPRLAIYSPTTDVASTVDDAFFDVENLWVDDAFDTVRSRGAKPTVRTTVNVVG